MKFKWLFGVGDMTKASYDEALNNKRMDFLTIKQAFNRKISFRAKGNGLLVF
jgi:hypothetical protein